MNTHSLLLSACCVPFVALTALHAAPGDQWTWRNPVSPYGTGSTGLKQAIVNAANRVEVGRFGLILLNGTVIPSGTRATLRDVAADGANLVAVGEENTILTSSDGGATWTPRSSGVAGTIEVWTNVQRSGGQWIASNSGNLIRSPDGVTWSRPPLAATLAEPYIKPAASGGTVVTARGMTYGTGQVAHSIDGGATWTRLTSAPGLNEILWNGTNWVALGASLYTSADGAVWTAVSGVTGAQSLFQSGGLMVAINTDNGGRIYTSPDGLTWSNRGPEEHTDIFSHWKAMASAGSTHVIIGEDGSALTSTDAGVTWSLRSTGAANLNTVVHHGGVFRATGGDGWLVTSADGLAWQVQSPGTRARLRAVAWHSGLWVAGGRVEDPGYAQTANEYALFTSPDGVTWTDRSFSPAAGGFGRQIYHVIRAGSQWVAVSAESALTSPDAITWTPHPVGNENRAVAFDGTRLVIAGGIEDEDGDSSGYLYFSTDDGSTWTSEQRGNSFLRGIVWTGTKFIAVGDDGVLHTSPTGAAGTWTTSSVSSTLDLRGIASDPVAGLVIVGGNYSTGPVVFTSPDGTTWTTRTVPGTNLLYSITRAGSLWIATGYDGTVLTSPDGITWKDQSAPTSHELYAGAWNGTEFLAAGEAGALLATGSGGAAEDIEWVSFTLQTGGAYRLEWESTAGQQYHIERSPDLSLPWIDVPGSSVTATGSTTSFLYTPVGPDAARMFFRVRQ